MINLKNILIGAGLGAMMGASAFGQGTAFTYQGRLNSGTNPAAGTYNLTFSLYNTSTGASLIAGPVAENGIVFSNGLFTTTVDFGPGVFIAATNWLQIAVATNGSLTFTNLAPRQQVTPTPYAVYAESANATNLVGSVQTANLSGVALLAGGNAFTGNQTVTGGNVGIGTTSPMALTEVRTATSARNMVFSGPGGGEYSFYDTTRGSYQWDIGGSTNGFTISRSGIDYPLIIDSAHGNAQFANKVGIGTNAPSQMLEVNGNAQIDGTLTATSFTGSGSGLTGINATNLTGTVPTANLSGVALLAGGNTFTGSQTVNAGANGTITLSPTQDNTGGNVGMGTASASNSKLTVYSSQTFGLYAADTASNALAGYFLGNVDISGNSSISGTLTAGSFSGNGGGLTGLAGTNVSGVALLAGGNQFNGLQVITNLGYGFQHSDGNHVVADYIDSLGGRIGTVTDSPFGFFVNSGYPSVMINTNGFMGIGTVTPAQSLEVNGSAQVDGTVVLNNSGTNNSLSFAGGGIQVAGAGINTATVAFVQRATAANLYSGDGTLINNPFCNNNPNAILIVTPNWNPGAGVQTYNNHPIGVYYNNVNWIIFNQDTAAMATNSAFNVLVIRP